MKAVYTTNAYERDLRKMAKRGKDLSKLQEIIDILTVGNNLSPRYRPHPLKGNWKPKWDCHIEPDWLLIYETTEIK